MDRISKLARPLGIAIAFIGVAMVAVSGYYLFAYMRSGTDAEEFNVDAAVPEQQLAFLGQGLPEPSIRHDDDLAVSQNSTQNDAVAQNEQVAVEKQNISGDAVPQNQRHRGAETVLISSAFPGAALAVAGSDSESRIVSSRRTTEDFPFTSDGGADVRASFVSTREDEIADTEFAEVETAMLGIAEEDFGADRLPVAPSMSTAEMLGTFGTVYPGGNMNPRYWSQPHWAGNLPFGGPTIPVGFVPVDASDATLAAHTGSDALRMRIPAIDLDAGVAELEIIDLGNSRAWSTPDKIVGHIPTTANPGELANGWYFGHLDNFLSNEGDIFRRLPEISSMLKNEYVDIFISTNDAEYMYRVTGTRQLHRSDLYITDSDNSQITLVTCWPFRVYDHRIVVSAVLVAVKPLQEV